MIINKEEVEKAAENYCNIQNIHPSDTALSKEVFMAGALIVESKVQEYVGDIIIENQGLKLYKDNEAERFKKLAVNFAYYCLMQDWLQNGFRCGGLSTEEIYDKFINDPDENI